MEKTRMEEVKKGLTVHRVEGEEVWASSGYRMFYSRDRGRSWVEDGRAFVRGWRRYTAYSPLLRRITRAGISSLLRTKDGSRLCTVPGEILRAEAGSSSYCIRSLKVPRGSRPLNLCTGQDGAIYWGEYFLNLRRAQAVRIFRSTDGGISWHVAYTFPAGSICHVHRIVYDAYEGSLLVCTGDRDREVAILRGSDSLDSLVRVAGGSQKYRTTSLIPRPSCIIYGTDCPSGPNFLMALDRDSGRAEELQRVPGPVLYGCEVGEKLVFATMAERRDHEVTLWLGDEAGFRLLAHFETARSHPLWRELAGYPTVVLPDGRGTWPLLLATPMGTRHYSGSLLRMELTRGTDESPRGEGLG